MEGLRILDKLEELDVYAHKAAMQFPKAERHVLSAEVRSVVAELVRLAIRAAKRHHKKTTLQDMDVAVEVKRRLIRKAFRLRYIDAHRYEVWSRLVDEIGRMVGAWLRSQRDGPGTRS